MKILLSSVSLSALALCFTVQLTQAMEKDQDEGYKQAFKNWKGSTPIDVFSPITEDRKLALIGADKIYNLALGEQNIVKAFNLLTQAARVGHLGAKKTLDLHYLITSLMAHNNDRDAQNLLGIMSYNGYGCPINYFKAAKLWSLAAHQEHLPAKKNLHFLCITTHQAADQGNPQASYLEGYLFENGYGVSKNIPLAGACYGQAALRGHHGVKNQLERLSQAISFEATHNNHNAKFALGVIHYYGYGCPINYLEVAKLWGEANAKKSLTILWNNIHTTAEQEDAQLLSQSLYLKGYLYENGYGVRKDIIKALMLYDQAAKRDHMEAENLLKSMFTKYHHAVFYGECDFSFKNSISSRDNLRVLRKGRVGDRIASGILGAMYENGWGVTQDLLMAAKMYNRFSTSGRFSYDQPTEFYDSLSLSMDKQIFFELATNYSEEADRGNSDAQYSLAILYEANLAEEDDKHHLTKAGKLYSLSAKKGHAGARKALTSLVDTLRNSAKQFKYMAFTWHNNKTQHIEFKEKYAKCKYTLGVFYQEGWGVIKNFDQALKAHIKAAYKGCADAQLTLESLCQKGLVGGKRLIDAVRLFSWISEQGHLGTKKALKALIKKLTADKSPEAFYTLGKIYENGWGVSPDRAKTVKLYNKAAKKGHVDAQCNRRRGDGKDYTNLLGFNEWKHILAQTTDEDFKIETIRLVCKNFRKILNESITDFFVSKEKLEKSGGVKNFLCLIHNTFPNLTGLILNMKRQKVKAEEDLPSSENGISGETFSNKQIVQEEYFHSYDLKGDLEKIFSFININNIKKLTINGTESDKKDLRKCEKKLYSLLENNNTINSLSLNSDITEGESKILSKLLQNTSNLLSLSMLAYSKKTLIHFVDSLISTLPINKTIKSLEIKSCFKRIKHHKFGELIKALQANKTLTRLSLQAIVTDLKPKYQKDYEAWVNEFCTYVRTNNNLTYLDFSRNIYHRGFENFDPLSLINVALKENPNLTYVNMDVADESTEEFSYGGPDFIHDF